MTTVLNTKPTYTIKETVPELVTSGIRYTIEGFNKSNERIVHYIICDAGSSRNSVVVRISDEATSKWKETRRIFPLTDLQKEIQKALRGAQAAMRRRTKVS